MKAKVIADSFEILKDIKLNGIESKNQFLIIKALRVLKPIVANYKDDISNIEDKVISCSKEELAANREKAQKQITAERNNDTENMLPSSEVIALNEFFNKVGNEINSIKEAIDNEDVELTYEKISEEDFEKLLSANSLTAENASLLYDLLV
jgi:hypothetical protein